MLPLAGSQLPDSPETLAKALENGLVERGATPREVKALGTWPALDLLRIDLTGTQLTFPELPKAPADSSSGSFTAQRFELLAAPGEVMETSIHASLQADGAGFSLTRSGDGGWALLSRATRGDAVVEVARADIERLVHSLASKAAGAQGVEIRNVKVTFTSRGPRAVTITAEVVAKMFIATATVLLSGDVDLDEHLNAKISNLRFHGDGMVANLAGGFIKPHLASFEGRSFPLMSFALGEISLRDIQLQAGETLRLTAQFSS